MDYNSRFYSPYLNRFSQPDSIIPDLTNTQAWNRFSYVINNPVNYTDPSGHRYCDLNGLECEDHGTDGHNGSDEAWHPASRWYGGGDNGTDPAPRHYSSTDARVTLTPDQQEELRSKIDYWIDVLDAGSDLKAGPEVVTTFLDAVGLLGDAGSINYPFLLVLQLVGWNAINNGLDDLRDFDRALYDYKEMDVTIELGYNSREWGILINDDIIIERTYDPVPLLGVDVLLDIPKNFENQNNAFVTIMKFLILAE